MVTEEGAVKVLDFGLAKALRDRSRDEEGEETTAVPSAPATKEGIVMGTPAYMSPEQVGGLAIDHRTDVWSFGVVLWEMLTGKRLFDGESTSEVLGAVLREEPAWGQLPADTPDAVHGLLERCLTRDRRMRLQAIGEARIVIQQCLSPTEGRRSTPTRRRKGRSAAVLLAAAGLGLLAGLSGGEWLWPGRPSRDPAHAAPPLRRWSLVPPQALNLTTHNTDLKLSPNGRHIAYRGDGHLWVLDLDKEQPRRIEGTGRAIDPFWSPDSAFIGYFAGGMAMKVPVQGGTPLPLCHVPDGEAWGASWSPDGDTIVISAGFPGRLYEVSAGGGDPKLILDSSEPASPSGGPIRSIYRPEFLPALAGARVVLFGFGNRVAPNIMMFDLDTRRRRVLGAGALPAYSPSGHVVYQETGLVYRLWAVPFSLETLDVAGRPFLVADSGRDAAVSSDGTLVYVDGDVPRVQLSWFDRRGRMVGRVGQPERIASYPALSPDASRLAVTAGDDWNFRDAWVYDLRRGVRTRLTAAPENLWNVSSPVWSPQGDDLAFTVSNRELMLRRADGSGSATAVLTTETPHTVTDWSSDGQYVLYEVQTERTGIDLRYLKRVGQNAWGALDFLATPFNESAAKVSPDGRYVAYVSDESGRLEVYVRPFPSGFGKWLVSADGGTTPVWRRDGRELFYLDSGFRLSAVAVSTRPVFTVGATTPLFPFPRLTYPEFDVSADGSRFILAAVVGETPRPVIRVVQNWAAEFQARQP
jgi:Tol biopolymer transport system component